MRDDEHNRIQKEFPVPVIPKEQIEFIIPQCCREGWDSCVHVAKKRKKTKQNVGL